MPASVSTWSLRSYRSRSASVRAEGGGAVRSGQAGIQRLFSPHFFPQVVRFTRDLAVMAHCGVPMSQALEILTTQTSHAAFKVILAQVTSDVVGGATLSGALEKHPAAFDTLYCSLIAAGEKGGGLASILKRLADYLEKKQALRRTVLGTLAYPAALAVIIGAVAAFMLAVVVPRFADIFLSLGGQLPLATRALLNLSSAVRIFGVPALLATAAGAVGAYGYTKTDAGRRLFDQFRLRVPPFGLLHRKLCIARFSQTLSTLLESGVGMLDALAIAVPTTGNIVLQKALLVSTGKIAGGQSVAVPLGETGFFPPMAVRMLVVGEKTGELASMLKRIAEVYEEEVTRASATMTSLVEPLLVVIMAILVGGILAALYLPMFEMINLIG